MAVRGQISLEYLIVVSFVMFAVIVLLGVSLFYASSVQDQIKVNQLSTFANKILNSAESVYYSGEPSKSTITAFLPEGVQDFEIVSNSLVFTFVTSSGTSIVAFESNVPLDEGFELSLNQGVKRLTITTDGDKIYVA
ncbi:hypothetical protein J4416_02080 [Candidatus Pacearchaeota archaeon]|nr:hypothetical protein [Candidatus Pacearchaeota archaeon]